MKKSAVAIMGTGNRLSSVCPEKRRSGSGQGRHTAAKGNRMEDNRKKDGKNSNTGKRTGQKKDERKKPDPKKGFAETQEERIRIVQGLNLFSDVFMSVVLSDTRACQHVLRVLLEDENLAVKRVKTQYRISRIVSRDVQLDVLAEGSDGRLYTAEIQRKSTLDHARRTRLHEAMVDGEYLSKGKDFHDLPEVYVIYISETDLWKRGKSSCRVERKFEEEEKRETSARKAAQCGIRGEKERSGKEYEDGEHILYVNAAVDDGTETAKLMKYFLTADPEDMSQGALSGRVRYLKREEGGQKIMCEVMDRIREEGRKEGRKEERANTVRERKRADMAEKKLREIEKELMLLRMQMAESK